jgi:hypothetical protein
MSANPFIYGLAGADIAATCLGALENVRQKTPGNRWSGGNRAGGIRTRDLLNPIQAHYQAVLRPDLEANY